MVFRELGGVVDPRRCHGSFHHPIPFYRLTFCQSRYLNGLVEHGQGNHSG